MSLVYRKPPPKSSKETLNGYYKLLATASHVCEPTTIHSTRQGLGFLNKYSYDQMEFQDEHGDMLMPIDDVNDDVFVKKVIPLLKKVCFMFSTGNICTEQRKLLKNSSIGSEGNNFSEAHYMVALLHCLKVILIVFP